MHLKGIIRLFIETIIGWSENEAPLHAAALAYYTIFSLAPLLILSVGIATQIFSQAFVEQTIIAQIEQLADPEVAVVAQEVLQNVPSLLQPRGLVTVVSILFILYGASAVFSQLRTSLNAMWGVRPLAKNVKQNVMAMAKTYLLSAVAALTVGFLVVFSLLLNALWTAIPQKYLELLFPNLESGSLILRFVASPIMFMIIFAVIFKTLPKAKIRWRDVWPGAAVTAILFWLGGYAIGLYLGFTVWTSFYGAASSIIAFLLWVYYSAWIFLFGAKFTQLYADKYGMPVVPDDDAIFIPSVVGEEVEAAAL